MVCTGEAAGVHFVTTTSAVSSTDCKVDKILSFARYVIRRRRACPTFFPRGGYSDRQVDGSPVGSQRYPETAFSLLDTRHPAIRLVP